MRRHSAQALAAGIVLALPIVASAQSQPAYPSRPVQVIVPYAPGGNPDVIARILAERLAQRFGKPFVVDNRPGANGNIAVDKLVTSPPDGYTLAVLDSSQTSINPVLYRKLNYGLKDLAPVAALVAVPTVLVLNSAVPANTVSEFVAYAKSHPGALNYGSAGNGSIHHLTAEMFSSAMGIKMTHVPYKGSSQTVPAVMAGDVQAAFVGIPAAKSLIETKKLRALGISTAQRSRSAPELATLAESGVPGFNVAALIGVFAPSDTSEAIKAELNDAIAKVMSDPQVQAKLKEFGMEPLSLSAAEYAKVLRADLERYGQAVREAKVAID
jgi:tripartite-type tricarboxylate transporter receptor subunit TctC